MFPDSSDCTPRSLSIDALKRPDVGDASATDALMLLKPTGPRATVSAPKISEPVISLVMSASKNGSAHALDAAPAESHVVRANDAVEREMLGAPGELARELAAPPQRIETGVACQGGHQTAKTRERIHDRRELERAGVRTRKTESTGGARAEAGGVQSERIDGRDTVGEAQARNRWIDLDSRERRILDRRHRAAGERRERRAAQVEIVLSGELALRQRVFLE